MKEKRFILAIRIIFLLLLLFNIFLPIILTEFKTELELVDSHLHSNYNETLGFYDYQLELVFNKEVSSGSVEVYLYDNNAVLIDSQTAFFYKTGSTVVADINFVYGKVVNYRLDDFDFYTELEILDFAFFLYYFLPITIVLFVMTFQLNYKKYEYNGEVIEVYAGYYKHYLIINNVKCDEHNTLVTFSPIVLTCILDSSDTIQAIISLSNGITLKINDKLCTAKKS